jgi:hypothetical protein
VYRRQAPLPNRDVTAGNGLTGRLEEGVSDDQVNAQAASSIQIEA